MWKYISEEGREEKFPPGKYDCQVKTYRCPHWKVLNKISTGIAGFQIQEIGKVTLVLKIIQIFKYLKRRKICLLN